MTVPLNSSVAFPVGSGFSASGFTGNVIATGGVTITGTQGNLEFPPGESIFLIKTATDTWTLNNGLPDASTTVKGLVELATDAETITGTDAVRATTPAGVAAAIAAAAGGLLVDGSGTTANGDAVDLGGTLASSANISVVGGTQFNVGTSSGTGGALTVFQGGDVTDAQASLNSYSGGGAATLSFGRSPTYGDGVKFYDNRTTKVGIEYSDDYSSDFTSRSLVDKAYVDAAVGGGGAVSSVFGRSGVVTATSGDYTATQITNTPAGAIAATNVQTALNELDTEKAPLASPALTGTPTAPTASALNNSTQIATTAYVDASVVNPMTTQGDIIVGGASGALSRLGIGSAYNLVRVNSGATSPQYFGLTTGSPAFWSATGLTEDNSNFFWDDTNNRLGIGFNAPTSKIEIQTNSLGVTQTATSGLALTSTTAAASLNQQISPAIRFSSNGWGTTAGTSQDVSFRIYSLPVQGATPTGSLVFERSTSGGAYASVGSISSAGVASFPNFNASSAVASNDFNRLTNAVMNISPSNIHSGIGVNFQYVSAANSIQTSGNQIYAQFTGGFFPTSGTATWQTIKVNNTITMSGGANGTVKFINIDPAITAAGGDVAGITYDPTITTITGNNYGIRIIPTSSNNGFGLAAPTATLHVVGTVKLDGSVTLPTAGNGILIKEGTNATMGVATLSSGTITVSTTKVTANSRIMLTVQSLGTVVIPTVVAVTGRSAGTSFTITSADITDTSIVAWTILEPAP